MAGRFRSPVPSVLDQIKAHIAAEENNTPTPRNEIDRLRVLLLDEIECIHHVLNSAEERFSSVSTEAAIADRRPLLRSIVEAREAMRTFPEALPPLSARTHEGCSEKVRLFRAMYTKALHSTRSKLAGIVKFTKVADSLENLQAIAVTVGETTKHLSEFDLSHASHLPTDEMIPPSTGDGKRVRSPSVSEGVLPHVSFDSKGGDEKTTPRSQSEKHIVKHVEPRSLKDKDGKQAGKGLEAHKRTASTQSSAAEIAKHVGTDKKGSDKKKKLHRRHKSEVSFPSVDDLEAAARGIERMSEPGSHAQAEAHAQAEQAGSGDDGEGMSEAEILELVAAAAKNKFSTLKRKGGEAQVSDFVDSAVGHLNKKSQMRINIARVSRRPIVQDIFTPTGDGSQSPAQSPAHSDTGGADETTSQSSQAETAETAPSRGHRRELSCPSSQRIVPHSSPTTPLAHSPMVGTPPMAHRARPHAATVSTVPERRKASDSEASASLPPKVEHLTVRRPAAMWGKKAKKCYVILKRNAISLSQKDGMKTIEQSLLCSLKDIVRLDHVAEKDEHVCHVVLKDKKEFELVDESESRVLDWMLSIDVAACYPAMPRLCSKPEAAFAALYKAPFKGGVIKSSYDEEWQYFPSGRLVSSDGLPGDLEFAFDGQRLMPRASSSQYGYGVWMGLYIRWYDSVDMPLDSEPSSEFTWNCGEREYYSPAEQQCWKWTRHFLANKFGGGEWIMEGNVPEPIVMFLQLLRNSRLGRFELV